MLDVARATDRLPMMLADACDDDAPADAGEASAAAVHALVQA